jgi:hypothetical protein
MIVNYDRKSFIVQATGGQHPVPKRFKPEVGVGFAKPGYLEILINFEFPPISISPHRRPVIRFKPSVVVLLADYLPLYYP